MKKPTDEEILAQEINGVEEALAEAFLKTGKARIIDPDLPLGQRVKWACAYSFANGFVNGLEK